MDIILASASPRRRQLLEDLGLPFRVEPFAGEEPAPNAQELQNPALYVENLARLKAFSNPNREAIVIAADTVVVLDGEILVKPLDAADARAMLRRMRGRTHTVYTGFCVRRGERFEVRHETTQVTFGEFSDEFLADYVATGEPLDKAGSYGAQGRGALLVQKIDGDYWNVVGLPLFPLERTLQNFDVQISRFWANSR